MSFAGQSYCYYLYRQNQTWGQASQTCSDINGTLAVDNTPETHQILSELLKSEQTDVWIGGHTKPHRWSWLGSGKYITDHSKAIITMVNNNRSTYPICKS